MTTTRRQNNRGEGVRLQEDIVAAARTILERTGRDDAVTLRAVAREAGITAPAIYAHFADREEVLHTVVRRTFTELATTLQRAAEGEDSPVPRLFAVCRAYLGFATAQPHHYRVLFERHRVAVAQIDTSTDVHTMLGADAFGVLLAAAGACIEEGWSSAATSEAAATRVWLGLHGQATLQASLPWFPWPDAAALLDDLVTRLADLRPDVADHELADDGATARRPARPRRRGPGAPPDRRG